MDTPDTVYRRVLFLPTESFELNLLSAILDKSIITIADPKEVQRLMRHVSFVDITPTTVCPFFFRLVALHPSHTTNQYRHSLCCSLTISKLGPRRN